MHSTPKAKFHSQPAPWFLASDWSLRSMLCVAPGYISGHFKGLFLLGQAKPTGKMNWCLSAGGYLSLQLPSPDHRLSCSTAPQISRDLRVVLGGEALVLYSAKQGIRQDISLRRPSSMLLEEIGYYSSLEGRRMCRQVKSLILKVTHIEGLIKIFF